MILTIDVEYTFEDVVFLKTDPEQLERIVTNINIKPSGAILYGLSCCTNDSEHYGFEITKERDVLKVTNN